MREKFTFSNIAKGSSFLLIIPSHTSSGNIYERKKAGRYEHKTSWFIGYYGLQVEETKYVVDKD